LDYKELQQQHQRFHSKGNQLARTNHLRLVLLRFLRLKTDVIMDPNYYKREMHQFVLKTARYGTKILIEWWQVLLEDLMCNHQSMSNVDRSAYLECISRIIARAEWKVAMPIAETYRSQLICTLEYCFTKLLIMKTISLPISAFIGKVFAYSYAHVDDFAHVLLFALFVKNFTVAKILPDLPKAKNVTKTDCIPSLLRFMDFTSDHDLSGEVDSTVTRLNCIRPPTTTTFGDFTINMKDNSWVKRWAAYESDIFCAFLRHYFALSSANYTLEEPSDLFHCPGFILIYAHVKDVFNHSCMSIINFKQKQSSENNPKMGNIDAIFASNSQGTDMYNFQKFVRKLPIIPYFALLRSILYECDGAQALNVTHIFEEIIMSKARTVNVFSSVSCEVVYALFIEFLIHLQHDSQKFVRHLNWKFWISGLIRMINTGFLKSQGRALSALFNLWSMLPLDYIIKENETDITEEWISNPDLTLIYNLSSYLISKPVWEMLLGHWDPLVRQFYIRLVVYKIIGSSGDNYGSYLNFKKAIKSNLNSTYDLLRSKLDNKKLSALSQLDLQPANPIPNKKFIITHMDPKSLTSKHVDLLLSYEGSQNLTSTLSTNSSSNTLLLPSNRKVYAYDIFDDAIYSSSLGSGGIGQFLSRASVSPNHGSPRGHSRSSSSASLGRVPVLSTALSFFKKVGLQAEAIPMIQTTIPSTNSSPSIPEYEEARSLRTSPYLPKTRSFSSQSSKSTNFLKHSPSSFSSPTSSISELSDEDFESIVAPKRIPSSRSLSSSASRISSTSSTTSRLSQLPSMDALPAPPELLTKTPDLKTFRMKFHLTVSQESLNMQQTIIKSTEQRFFGMVNQNTTPMRPKLPYGATQMGLLHGENFGILDSDEDEEVEEFLMIQRKPVRSLKSDISFQNLKNHMLLGKFLNEWNCIVDEYEIFSKMTSELENDDDSFVDPMLLFDGPGFFRLK
jgi:hypothetical protein